MTSRQLGPRRANRERYDRRLAWRRRRSRVVDGRIDVGRTAPASCRRDIAERPTRSTTSATCRCCRASSRRISTCTSRLTRTTEAIARPEPVERLAHPRDGRRCADLVLSGATTARDTGSRLGTWPSRSASRDEGRHVPGPRLMVVGAPITTTAGHYWFLGAEADTADAVIARDPRGEEGRRRRDQADGVGRWLHADLQPALAAIRRRDPGRGRRPRRTGWGCRSWPTR